MPDAYATFRHPAVCPLVQLGDDEWLLELFHGPTLAFKDVALQLVGRLFDHVLAERGDRVTIVGATIGRHRLARRSTPCAGRENVDIVVLYPAGRVSDVQRRQMTTVDAPNVRDVAVEGTFDDCQDLVKAMFADAPFRERHRLAAVNSINWARVMAQVVYYATAAASLGGRPVTFAVPTGQLRQRARRLDRQAHRRCRSTSSSSAPTATTSSPGSSRLGTMVTADVVPTSSPSMDIQVSSNFERLLFEVNGRDGGMTAEQLLRFRATGRLVVEDDVFDEWLAPVFRAASLDDEATLAIMRRVHAETGMLVDPHTAVGIGAAPREPPAGCRDGQPGHGPPGQVPRRRRAGDRDPAGAPGAPGRPRGPPGADDDAPDGPGHGRGVHRQRGRRRRRLKRCRCAKRATWITWRALGSPSRQTHPTFPRVALHSHSLAAGRLVWAPCPSCRPVRWSLLVLESRYA